MFNFINKSLFFQFILIFIGLSFVALNIFYINREATLLSKIYYSLFVVINIILIQIFSKKSIFFTYKNYSPIILFLFIVSATTISTTHCYMYIYILFANLLLLISINYPENGVKSRLFFSGIILALMCCLEPASIIFLPFMVIIVVYNQFSKLKDLFAMLAGFVIPLIHICSYCFIIDKFYIVSGFFANISMNPAFKLLSLNVKNILLLTAFYICILVSIIILKIIFNSKKIYNRRQFGIIVYFILFLFLISLFPMIFVKNIFSIFVFPSIFIFSILAQESKNHIVNDIVIMFSIILLCL